MQLFPQYAVVIMSWIRYSKTQTAQPDLTYLSPTGVRCFKCTPGSHLLHHCTEENTGAICRSCENGTFTSDYNVAESCETCLLGCETDELVQTVQCSNTTKMECRCPNGKFNKFPYVEKCQEHTSCGPGYGVRIKGTAETDTMCESCTTGSTFSLSTSNIDSCKACSTCDDLDVLLDCTGTQDRICDINYSNRKSLAIMVFAIGMAVISVIAVIMGLCLYSKLVGFPCRASNSRSPTTLSSQLQQDQNDVPLSDIEACSPFESTYM